MSESLVAVRIDSSEHFLDAWGKIYRNIAKQEEKKADNIKKDFLYKAKTIFGEPFTNVACTNKNYRLFLSTLNPILNMYGFMLAITCSDKEKNYLIS